MKTENEKTKTNKAFKQKFAAWFWGIIGAGLLTIVLVFWMITKGWLGYLPPLDELQNPKNKFATEVISADMQLLGRYYRNENRVSVDYTDISPNMINALIATEDVRYYDHTGVDVKSLMRAIMKLGKGAISYSKHDSANGNLYLRVHQYNSGAAFWNKSLDGKAVMELPKQFVVSFDHAAMDKWSTWELRLVDENGNQIGVRYFGAKNKTQWKKIIDTLLESL